MVITNQLLSFTVLLLLVHLNFLYALNVLCKERERRALLDIKAELIDDYGYLSSWSSEEEKRDCCKWSGITCSNRTGHVTKLALHFTEYDFRNFTAQNYSPLRGKISHSLLDLSYLTYLDLSSNDFGGSYFPFKKGSFPVIKYLNLSNANLGGEISYILRNCSRLQSLDLRYNYFHDIGNVEWLFNLYSLSYLDLSFNQLIRPHKWLQLPNNLLHLESLKLSLCFEGNNEVIRFPINSSSSLTTINLSYNHLVISSVKLWFSNITHNIKNLDLSFNNLQSSTFSDFCDMILLEHLSLPETKLSGDIPMSFGNMSRLKRLDLSSNNLIQNLSGSTQKSLQYLILSGNEMTGSLANLSGFSSLRHLCLLSNRLNGTVEKSIGQLSNLEHLILGWNSFNGVISEDHFKNLSNLTNLVLSGNSLVWNVSVGWIPPFRLRYIYLRSCKIGPNFPNWLQSQKNYLKLDISDAGISDSIPKWFWNLSSQIYHLNLSHNNLSGPVQDFPVKTYAFSYVDLSFNRLDGSLPIPLYSSKLWYSSNRSFASNTGDVIAGPLFYFDLSSNMFSGIIPDCLMNFQDLVVMNLANNNLSGPITTSIGSLWKLETLSLGNNFLSGELPSSLRNCTRLRFLDFSNNRLFGKIPTWIGESVSSLQYLSLKSNEFGGSIPLQFCRLTKLQILDISVNNINGIIPSCFNNLKAMTYGNLSIESIAHNYFFMARGFSLYFMGNVLHTDKAWVLWKGSIYMLDRNFG